MLVGLLIGFSRALRNLLGLKYRVAGLIGASLKA